MMQIVKHSEEPMNAIMLSKAGKRMDMRTRDMVVIMRIKVGRMVVL